MDDSPELYYASLYDDMTDDDKVRTAEIAKVIENILTMSVITGVSHKATSERIAATIVSAFIDSKKD
jgi:hypothetical protein